MGQALVAVVALMLGSAIERMQRYIGVFGRSLDRLYASVAMCWIAVALAGFGCTVLRCRRDKFVAVVVRVRGSRWCW